VRALVGPGGDQIWMLALAIASLACSVLVGRYHGNVVDFFSGLFLGLSLAVSVFFLVNSRRRSPAAPTR
jgi:hypothetical protein